MSALQLWLQNHNRRLTQDAIDEALMEYITHVEKQRDELLAALTYVIEDLELRASLKEDEDERDVVDIGNGAYTQAKEALALLTDSTQILAEVRRAERERVALHNAPSTGKSGNPKICTCWQTK